MTDREDERQTVDNVLPLRGVVDPKPSRRQPAPERPNGKQAPPVIEPPSSSPFGEIALAERLVERHLNLRYVAAWSKWMRWSGALWKADNTLHVFNLARVMLKEVAATVNKRKDARELTTAKTVASVERLAKADQRVAAEAEDWWDIDADIINDGDSK